MTTPFAALEDTLSDEIDSLFAETWTHLPMRQPTPNSRREADPDRTQQTFQAAIDDRNPGSSSFARLGATSGGKAHGDGAPQFTASNPMLFLDERRVTHFPVRLDRVRRHATGAIYELVDLSKDGQGRWKIAMAKVG